ncbi:MAG: YlbF family regulator [Lachnospiraceae bacterium]|nr:YlbF family regulator [Lachnospiraceae bacterium]
MLSKEIEGYTQSFLEKIKTTDIYLNYLEQVKKIKNYPDLLQQINEYRDESFMIQNKYEGEELYDKTEELSAKYEKFLEIPVVDDFMNSELALVRTMQDINMYIVEGLDFQ